MVKQSASTPKERGACKNCGRKKGKLESIGISRGNARISVEVLICAQCLEKLLPSATSTSPKQNLVMLGDRPSPTTPLNASKNRPQDVAAEMNQPNPKRNRYNNPEVLERKDKGVNITELK